MKNSISGSQLDPGLRITMLVIVFESGLGCIGLLAAGLVGYSPLDSLQFSMSGVLWGLAATIPVAGLIPIFDRVGLPSIRRIRAIVTRYIVPLFRPCSRGQLAAIGMSAGIAEEILFRGFLQGWIIESWGTVVGVTVASILFGAVHLVTPGYGILAGVLGAYMGILHVVTGNLLVPILTHGVYDVVALWFLVRNRPALDNP